MKHQVTRFKSLKVGLKEIEPFIRDGKHLQTGKPFKRFGGLRSANCSRTGCYVLRRISLVAPIG